uniref:Uncharacterized protein n=1 Tax=Kalanchoe fedtschenkoi TaxID=63787 RepID=A0A7N0U179_KALFE
MYQPPNKDLKSFTFCSIYRESFNIISSNTKLFTQIALFIIFPLSVVGLFATPFDHITNTASQSQLNATTPPADTYDNLSSPWTPAAFLIYNLARAALNIGLSLLYFSSLTYAVASIYTEHTNITFYSAICAFKKVWKKLLLTRLAMWAAMMGYTLMTGLLLILPVRAVSSGSYRMVASLAIFIISLVYAGGLIYMVIVWIFGAQVAVLESTCGFKALSRSRILIKGKAFLTISVLVPIALFSLLVAWMVLKVVVNGDAAGIGIVTRIGCGIVALPVMTGLTLLAVVVETVTYLVCKADKGESVTKSSVMEHLDMFVDGYALVRAKDEQI